MAEKHKREYKGHENGGRGQGERGTSAMARHRPESLSQRAGGFPLGRLRSEWDRMFDQFFQGLPSIWQHETDSRWDLDVDDQEDKFVVRAEAPGFEPTDFDVQVRDDQLVLCACQSEEHADDGHRHWQRKEFYRSIPFTGGIDAEHVDAQYRNGILTVTLPKTEQGKGKRIEVKG